MESDIVPELHPEEAVQYGCIAEQVLAQPEELLQREQQQTLHQQAFRRELNLQQDQKHCSRQQQRQQMPLQQQQQHQGYSTCGGDEGVEPAGPLFVEKMSLLMEQLATCGDETSGRPTVATRFDSICPPATTISAYIPRLYRHFRCSEEVFVFALIYLDRVIRENNIKINALNIHRLVLAASVIGVKFVEDVRYSNRYYARVGGVGLAELNRLELAFLKLVKFDLAVSKEDYETYRKTVLLACPRRSAAETTTCRTEQQLSQQHAEANSAASCEEAPEGPSSGAASKVSSDAAGDEFESTAATTTATATTANISSTPTAAEPPRALHALAQQQDKSQETQQQQQEQASCFRCFVAVSNSSTVSTTPESGPPYVPPSAACGTAPFRGAVQQGHIQDRNVRAAHRDESASQEEALRRHLVQQWHQHGGERQWQNCGMGFVGIQHQEQLPLQHARRVLQSQHYQLHCWDCAAAEQQQVPKQPSRVHSQERVQEMQQQQHHQQLLMAQQLLLLRDYHHQQQVFQEQHHQQLLRQQQLLMMRKGEYIMYEASMSPSNSFAPSRSSSRDSLSLCGGFGMETDDKMTTAASDEELQLASPMNALRDVLAAEAP
ncbi:uncharacterized protein LOC34621131 [Cyclospora cayetanensis]|uniref:Uncharacterized protein LOC34621131 n=1 Tax=Cyclospora cayetanensis TaxID=88456 RepID=A0A6P6RSR2_9EIME|nr:uncharacterized protein LOC34621131 [Cyclospora cayetanensis]